MGNQGLCMGHNTWADALEENIQEGVIRESNYGVKYVMTIIVNYKKMVFTDDSQITNYF